MLQPAPAQRLDALLKSISDLPPAQIVKAEAALAAACRRVEAVVEIDAVGKGRACPHYGSVIAVRGGRRGQAFTAGSAKVVGGPGLDGPALRWPICTGLVSSSRSSEYARPWGHPALLPQARGPSWRVAEHHMTLEDDRL